MKKMFIMMGIMLLVASYSYAASSASGVLGLKTDSMLGKQVFGDDATAGNAALIGKCSTNVSVAWQTTTLGYAIATQHASGTKAYGSSYDSTAIFQTEGSVTPGTVAFTGGAINQTDTTDFVDWKQM